MLLLNPATSYITQMFFCIIQDSNWVAEKKKQYVSYKINNN